MADNVVVKASVTAEVGGIRLGVSEATITLGVNAIPSINLTCAPTEGKMRPLKPDVMSVNRVGALAEVYRKLASKAPGLSTPGKVKITLDRFWQNNGVSTVPVQEVIELDWILSSVGLSGIGAKSAPYMSVILQHPICKLTKVGSIYETPRSEYGVSIDSATANARDLLEIMAIVYSQLRTHDEWFWDPPPGEAAKAREYRHRLGAGEFDPREYLFFKSQGGEGPLFLGVGGDLKERIAQAIGRFVTPIDGGSSTWDVILKAAGHLMLSVVQDEKHNFMTKQLVLEPSKPWKKATVRLKTSHCHSTDVPGVDPFRIVGVMCRKLGSGNNLTNLGLLDNGNLFFGNGEPVEEMLYSPKGVTVDTSDGRIMKTACPMILDSAYRRNAPWGRGGIALMDEKAKEALKEGYNTVVTKYAKALYENTVAAMVQVNAHMALWPRDQSYGDFDGEMILPGNTCVMEEPWGEPLFYGYIRNVVHHLSVEGGCSTIVSMSHVRPDEDYKVADKVAIAAGSPNAAYV